MEVFDNEDNRLRPRPCQNPGSHCRQLPSPLLLGREIGGAAKRKRDVHERSKKRRIFGWIKADQTQGVFEVCEALCGRSVRAKLDLPGIVESVFDLRCPPFELKRADEVERRMAADGIVQVLTRRHTVRKLATRSRSSTLGIPGWDALFAFMR